MALLIKLSFLHCIHRICLGLYFAENSMWIATATIHYCFEIKRVKKNRLRGVAAVVDFDKLLRLM